MEQTQEMLAILAEMATDTMGLDDDARSAIRWALVHIEELEAKIHISEWA